MSELYDPCLEEENVYGVMPKFEGFIPKTEVVKEERNLHMGARREPRRRLVRDGAACRHEPPRRRRAFAPRLLAVGSAEDDWWACPSAEFCSWECARSAFQRLKCMDHTTYNVRHGGHDITPEDWREYLDFAEKHGWMARETP